MQDAKCPIRFGKNNNQYLSEVNNLNTEIFLLNKKIQGQDARIEFLTNFKNDHQIHLDKKDETISQLRTMESRTRNSNKLLKSKIHQLSKPEYKKEIIILPSIEKKMPESQKVLAKEREISGLKRDILSLRNEISILTTVNRKLLEKA